MTTTTFDVADAGRPFPSAPRATKMPLSTRISNALQEVGRQRAEREIAAYIQARGGRTTDRLERDIERYCSVRGIR